METHRWIRFISNRQEFSLKPETDISTNVTGCDPSCNGAQRTEWPTLLKEIKTYFIKKILIKLRLNIYKGIYQIKKEGRMRTEIHCNIRDTHWRKKEKWVFILFSVKNQKEGRKYRTWPTYYSLQKFFIINLNMRK